MIDELIENIISYIDFLKINYNLYITVHDSSGFLSRYMYRFVPYNIHSNPYCLCVKSNKELWDKCIFNQKKVVAKCADGIFFGMCYAGCEEYVVPISHNNSILGFISVSGYSKDQPKALSKIDHLCKNYILNKKYLLETYDKCLEKTLPDFNFIKCCISTISNLFELMHIKSIELYGNSKFNNSNQDYILGHVLSYIEQNFKTQLTIEDISKACHSSESYISHMFKKRTQTNIISYVNNLRIKESKRLLFTSNLSIQEISSIVGFSDSNYFSNKFKKYCDMSPKKFRYLNKK